MRVLISGIGVAGPTLAYWLCKYGHSVTLVERAPKFRTGGYIIDFWGTGYEIAGRMGLLPRLEATGYKLKEVIVVDGAGNRISGFPAEVFSRVTHDRYFSLPRTALSAAIFEAVSAEVEVIFGDSIARLEENRTEVVATFESDQQRRFDLVVGADGLHSRVRELVFGPEQKFEKYLGFKVAAFAAEGYRPRDELTYLMYTQVGQQISRFSMRDDRTMFLFTFSDRDPDIPTDVVAQKAILRQRFGSAEWEAPAILNALDTADGLYFDRVSQIRMEESNEAWSKGRIVLLGDAANCASLLAGEGCGLAITAAYILAGELHRANGDHQTAFANYAALFGPFVRKKQKTALGFAESFAPKSRFSKGIRNQVMKSLRIPVIADIVFRRGLANDLALPDYEAASRPA